MKKEKEDPNEKQNFQLWLYRNYPQSYYHWFKEMDKLE